MAKPEILKFPRSAEQIFFSGMLYSDLIPSVSVVCSGYLKM